MRTALLLLICAAGLIGQSIENRAFSGIFDGSAAKFSVPGVAYVNPALGNGVTASAVAIQAELDRASISKVIIPNGDFAITGVNIPMGKTLECAGGISSSYPAGQGKLLYTGTGSAVTMAGYSTLRGCYILKSGGVAGVGIEHTASNSDLTEFNFVSGFAKGEYFNGAASAAGLYYMVSRLNSFEANTVGIDSSASGGYSPSPEIKKT